ncbi:hypothetical protein ACET3X_004418 [Alternaria dauci]|uniref:Uncharacterized protein n=1 Tax=Alternaria dauci TaxID=48095 RepID=A0ABR3UMW3_9PLEO
MENMDASPEAQPCRSFAECMLAFEDLKFKTEGIITIELNDLEKLLNTMRGTLDEVATKKATVWVQQLTHMRTRTSYFEQNVDGNETLSQAETRLSRESLPPCTCHHASDLMIDDLQIRIADQVLFTMEAFWKNRPTDIEELKLARQKMDECMYDFNKLSAEYTKISRALEDAERKKEDLEIRLAASENNATNREKLLSDKYRELERDYYRKVQKLVESRVHDEKARFAGRLEDLEAKALRYAKLLDENKLLEAKILQGDREQVLLKRVKLEVEKKYRDRDDEARAFKEGYDQISNDIQMLQIEKAVLQADYDGLKGEQERWSKEHTSSSDLCRVDQPAVPSPHTSAGPAFDRQTAELQHLTSLITIWQATLHNVTAERNGSINRKKMLEEKIREAKQHLKKLKRAPSSKFHRGSDTRSTPRNPRTEKQVIMNGIADGQKVGPSSVSSLAIRQKPRIAAEAFPALSSTAVKTVPPNNWKSLRLVDMPKEQEPDMQKGQIGH